LISVRKVSDTRTGWKVDLSFQINLHSKDLAGLKLIQDYFKGVGAIHYNERRNSVNLMVGSLEEISNVIIPHFDKYPLITKKFADYFLWRKVVMMVSRKEHLNTDGLQAIINIRAGINLGLSELLKKEFPNTVVVKKLLMENPVIPDPQWIAGFTAGEGCFFISTFKSKTKIGVAVRLKFILVQHVRDEQLIKSFIEYFGCGNVQLSKEAVYFVVEKFSDLEIKIIPFFVKYTIIGVKGQDFQDFLRAAELIKEKKHLTQQGLDRIRKIKDGMNKGRSV